VSIGAPASTSELIFSGNRAATMAATQPPWQRPTRFNATTEIVDRYNHVREIIVDLQIFHIFGRRLPVVNAT